MVKQLIFLLACFMLMLLPMAYSCDDISYTVFYIGNGSNGCWDGLSFYIEKKDCNQSCFSNFSDIVYSTDNNQEWEFKMHSPPLVSNPFVTIIKTINCSDNIPTTFYANLIGENNNCSFSFSFEQEHKEYLKKISEQEEEQQEAQNSIVIPGNNAKEPSGSQGGGGSKYTNIIETKPTQSIIFANETNIRPPPETSSDVLETSNKYDVKNTGGISNQVPVPYKKKQDNYNKFIIFSAIFLSSVVFVLAFVFLRKGK